MKTALHACKGYTFYTKTVIDAEKIHTMLLHAKDFKLVKVLGPYIEIIKKNGIPFLIEDKSNIDRFQNTMVVIVLLLH
jgi:hypothetical protein